MHCRHFGVCGGCSWPDVPYAEQLERKRARLSELLRIDVPPLLPSPRDAGFRSKVTFVFGSMPGARGLVMGHYAAGSRQIVPIEECPVHSSRGNRIAFALYACLARAGIRAADSGGGILRHIIVRTSEDESEAVAMLVVSRNDKSLRAPVRALLASADRPDGFFLNVHAKGGAYMIGRETIKIDGRSHVREGGLRDKSGSRPVDFLVSPTAFFQTNVGAARELVDLVRQGVGAARRVLDLYCGSGLFALPLAATGVKVTAIEENPQAIEDLEVNIRLNRISDSLVRPVCARVEDALARVSRESWDAVVLDPPRHGCAPGVLHAVFEGMAVPRAVYVSCNPEALAADLPFIRNAGYRIQQIQPVDMFPHTEHIETVVVLVRSARL